MSNRTNSLTRFRQMSAPRIRSAPRLDDSPDRHRNISATSVKKFRPAHDNPETPRVQHKEADNEGKIRQLASAEYTRDTFRAPESPVKKFAENPPPVTKKQVEIGRKLEYPQGRPETRFVRKLNEEESPTRSFSSTHFPSRTSKGDRIREDREVTDHKFSKALDYLISTNKAFIEERKRLCCQKAKPFSTKYKLPQANVLSTYQDHYPPKSAHLDRDFYPEPQNEKQAFGLPDGKVPTGSTYRRYHDGREGEGRDNAEWDEGFKLKGPIADVTTYHNHFPHPGDYDRMVPIASWDKAPTGLPFSGNSDHRRSYVDPKGSPSKIANWNNLHPYGNDFDPNRGTTYGSLHNGKERQPIQAFPIPYEETLKSPGKFGSEYRDEFIDKNGWPINQSNKCKC